MNSITCFPGAYVVVVSIIIILNLLMINRDSEELSYLSRVTQLRRAGVLRRMQVCLILRPVFWSASHICAWRTVATHLYTHTPGHRYSCAQVLRHTQEGSHTVTHAPPACLVCWGLELMKGHAGPTQSSHGQR